MGKTGFCRFLCPWGAFLKLPNSLALFKVRKTDKCTHCHVCTTDCPVGIDVSYEINTFEKVDHDYKPVVRYNLETDGTNLLDVLNNEYIDVDNTFSNNIIEIYSLFGIEAARYLLIDEIINVVKHEGEYINTRHIELLCDIMTSRGELLSINRQGIKIGDIGPLAKCSFEDTTDQLIKASIFSEKDNLKGVSSNIMMGQNIKCGTGICEILLDEDQLLSELKKVEPTEEEFLDIDESNIDIIMDIDEEDNGCGDIDLKFSHE